MPRLASLFAPLMALLLVACAAPVRHARFVAAVPYATAPLPARAKIFLVAGGVEVANFAEEVVAQRALWLARGFRPDEIACYWARPRRGDFRGDREQYRRLADELKNCYPASAALLRAHLRQQSARGLPFVYLYVSSHGLADIMPTDVPEDRLLPSERDLFAQYVIQMGAGVGRGYQPGQLALAMRRGADPRDLAFTPAALHESLQAFPAETPKLVVLQACHSGGFLLPDVAAGTAGLTAIAAARHDRTSFGCESGARFTYFGAAYLRRLLARPGPPTAIDWPALYRELAGDIEALERRAAVLRSLPVFLQTP
ncbi:MAG: hypothetical protein JNL82_00490 [Myxococcales bacterium]|nr:hypothetical protein [Myxococcales bacterium]